MSLNWQAIILVFNTSLCFVLGLILLATPRENAKSSRPLVFFIFSIAAIFIIQLLSILYPENEAVGFLFLPVLLLVGPSLYRYIVKLIEQGSWQGIGATAHWVPALLIAILNWQVIAFLFSPDYFKANELLVNAIIGFNFYYLSLGTYTLISLRKIYLFEREVKNNCASDSLLSLGWLKMLCWSFVFLIIVDLGLGFLVGKFASDWFDVHTMMLLVILTAIIGLAFGAIRQPEILSGQLVENTEEKYQKSGFKSDLAETLKSKLSNLMEDQKPFLESELSLKDLSELAEMSPHQLSQLLNESFEMNFYDFINRYRVDYAKELLVTSNSSVTDIGYASGFNSKASFYNAFKKWVNLPPAKWRKARQ